MVLLSNAAITSARRALEVVLVHTCTVTPMVDGVEDSEGNVPRVPGTAVPGVPCRFEAVQRTVRDEGGLTLVSVPSLAASATGPVAVGVRVEAVTDQLGTVLLDGPARVERVLDDTAGLGAGLLPVYELRMGRVSA